VAILVVAPSAAAAGTPRKKKVVQPLVSNTIHVVVPHGQPVQIAFAADPGFGGAMSLTNAIQMAVANHPTVFGFPIRINTVNAAVWSTARHWPRRFATPTATRGSPAR
jgi:hypothetical protein